MDRARLDGIMDLVAGIWAPAGYQCVEVEWVAHERILRLFVDRLSDAGDGAAMDLDACVKASKLLEEVPEWDAAVTGGYTLEVSTPGIERPLRRRCDFERHVGDTVQVRLATKVQERRNGTGRLVGVQPAAESSDKDATITLETEQGPWSFPLTTLMRASLVYDWGGV